MYSEFDLYPSTAAAANKWQERWRNEKKLRRRIVADDIVDRIVREWNNSGGQLDEQRVQFLSILGLSVFSWFLKQFAVSIGLWLLQKLFARMQEEG